MPPTTRILEHFGVPNAAQGRSVPISIVKFHLFTSFAVFKQQDSVNTDNEWRGFVNSPDIITQLKSTLDPGPNVERDWLERLAGMRDVLSEMMEMLRM